MNGAQAVFLSYASQDAEAARRICDALQAQGLEVWFDQSGLRGGDAWDAMIRRQVKACALFVPVISASTNARREGYFRLEWRLAVERSQLMADDETFLLPVVIDDTAEPGARVPDRFRERQWSRLDTGESLGIFAERVARLLPGSASRSPTVRPEPVEGPSANADLAQRNVHLRSSATDETPSIAVLPFVNLSRDEEAEYFADGLAEELLSVLAKIRGLRVASRTSAFFFKGKAVDLATIADKLGVATILEGSVRKSGNRVRIAAQLIQVASDSHLWSGAYDRTLDDIFAVQDDIAGAVVEELRTTLMGESAARAAAEAKAEVAAASSARADNPEAYQLYIQGRYYLERRTETDLAKAVDYFEQAIALDRQFALGWVGLSSARQTQAAYGWVPLREGFERARDAAERAIALAPDLAEAHISLGIVLGRWDWNWKGEIREMRQAVALAPANADALYSLGNALARQRNKDESLALLRRAVALDPLSSNKRRNLGGYCFEFGLPEEAEREMEVAFDLNSRGAGINQQWSILCLLQGRNVRALELAEREPARPFDLLGIACARHAMGEREASDAALAEMIADYANDSAYQVAEVHAWRGERDAAFEWLERACVQRDPGIVSAFVDPLLRGIHGDPRWMTLMKKTGFVE